MSDVNVTATAEDANEERTKLIFNQKLAKYLVKDKGLRIIDLKENRDNKDRTVFVFYDNLDLRDAMADYNKFKRYRRRDKPEEDVEDEIKEPLMQED